ncbi:MAG: D-alanine--D-alanine ligase [Alphaproteobacteria bacterium]|nr:D-alanine--D-alanine ligase [Alphaproteobacteria bacterium]MCB9930959.1 D-alanine--D-alanine ligase [Alphaproteobacteria bacterium]
MLNGLFIPVVHGATEGRLDEADTVVAAEAVAAALQRLGAATEIVHVAPNLVALDWLALRRPDAVFNLVEALGGDGGRAADAIARMQALGFAHTGAGGDAYTASSDKLAAKLALQHGRLPTPVWSSDGGGFSPAATVIVKSATEHASLGLDAASVVPAALAPAEIAAREARFGGHFFAEAYIEGREFNLSVLDGQVLPPAEIRFHDFAPARPRIVDWAAKWETTSHAYAHTPRSFAFWDRDAALLAQLKRLALQTCRLFGLAAYARVDFRVDAEGRPWILEANANPCLTPDAGFAAAAAAAGIPYDALIERIVRAALPRPATLALAA